MLWFKKYIKATVLLVPLLFIKTQLHSQCDYNSLLIHFPATVNGITVNESNTEPTQYWSSPHDTLSYCNVLSGTLELGYSGAFTQMLTFSSQVNNVIYILNASDSSSNHIESFSFSVNNGGVLSCAQNSSCLYTQQGNLFKANCQGGVNCSMGNAACITITSTIPYDTIKVIGTGGNGGSLMSLCANSINASGIKEIENKKQNLSLYPNPSNGKLYISNFDANQKNANIEVTDVTGNLIVKQQSFITNNTVELNLDVNNGIYFVKTTNEKGETQVQKVIINK